MLLMMSLPILSGARQQSFLFGSTTVTPAMMTLALWATLPIIFALTQGAIAKFDIWGKTAMPAFFATRPMTTSQFVFIKLCTVAVSSIGSWAVSFGLFTVWAALEASSLNSHPSLIRAAWASATPRSAAIMFFILVGLVAMTWRNTASGLWTVFLGRKYLSNSIGFAYMAAYTLAGLAGIWIYKHPEYHPFLSTLVPWFVGALVALKLGVALGLSLALLKRGLIEPKTMRLLAAGWLLMFGCLVGGLSLVTLPTWGLAAIVVFVLPFPSLAASPLALEWNRHR
jgi:hypothetical protein